MQAALQHTNFMEDCCGSKPSFVAAMFKVRCSQQSGYLAWCLKVMLPLKVIEAGGFVLHTPATLPPQTVIKFLDSPSPPRGAFRERHEARDGRRGLCGTINVRPALAAQVAWLWRAGPRTTWLPLAAAPDVVRSSAGVVWGP